MWGETGVSPQFDGVVLLDDEVVSVTVLDVVDVPKPPRA